MLKKLRIRLTLLYLVSSIFLALLVGGAAYYLVWYYFRSSNDQALKARVGVELLNANLLLPADLATAVTNAGFQSGSYLSNSGTDFDGDSDDEISSDESDERHLIERESNLADIYILPLTVEGELLSGFNAISRNLPVNLDAITAAQENGFDFRTFKDSTGHVIRLFTYVASSSGTTQIYQAGRYLTTQLQVMDRLLRTMVWAIGLETILFGLGSWLLAGRTIKPSQSAWDKQLTFIANASHELRAPLTLVRAGVETGYRKTNDPGQREILADALVDIDYMKKLIEDLLLISRMDAHSLVVEIKPVQLDQFIKELARALSRVVENQEARIDLNLEEVAVFADPVRLKQVLLIVLDNALRNSPPGGIVRIEAFRQSKTGVIKVTDFGQGIKAEDLEKVFDRFYKVDNQSTLEYRGSGLGLSIAKGLIESQKGHIEITSEPEKWTTVTISLPLGGSPA